jgi:hypothetical protein
VWFTIGNIPSPLYCNKKEVDRLTIAEMSMHDTNNLKMFRINFDGRFLPGFSYHRLLDFFIPIKMSSNDTVVTILIAGIKATE